MHKWIRWIIVGVLATLLLSPVFAQDNTTLNLQPFTDENYGISGVAPQGWTSAGPGLLARNSAPGDHTLIAQQVAPFTADKVMQSLLPQLALSAPPDSVGTRQTDALDWTLYKVTVQSGGVTIVVDFALAEDNGKTYVALMQTTSDEYDNLHTALFLPMLDALKPLSAESTEEVPYQQIDVTFKNGDVTLAGTLTEPQGDGPFPAMVLVTGSGAQDRNESLAPAAAIKPFYLIADYLTRKGIAILRWDDRGVGKSTGDFASAVTSDFAGDAKAAIEFLKTRSEIDPKQIGLLGHSEGGDVAAMLGASDPDLAFIVSMAGPAVSGKDILLSQNEDILKSEGASQDLIKVQLGFLPQLFTLIAAKDADGIRKLTHDTLLAEVPLLTDAQKQQITNPEVYATQQADVTASTYNTDWFRFFLSYDPGPDWAKTKIPVLAIYGGKDTQVDAQQNSPALDAEMKQAGNTDYKIVTLPNANHLMQEATTGSPSEYGTLKQEFTPDFLPTIGDWLLQHVKLAPGS